jgi:4-amino-4-deoxy-L-arabinose transferase-like glycosyltransferase
MLTLPSLPVTLILALALRLLWAVFIPVDPVSDSDAYRIFATNIVEHGVYGFRPDEPGAYWAVGTAAIYAGSYFVFGSGSDIGVVLVNLLSSLAIVWLLHDLGQRWLGEREGRIAALLFALWPLAIQFTTVLASELHFMALSLAALSCWDRVRGTPAGVGFLLLAGLCFGAATYIRPIALLLPAALAMASVLKAPRTILPALSKAVVATVLIFALVAPWSARNERIFGTPVFMSTNFWPNFWMGNHSGTNGGYVPLPPETQGMSEIERSEYLKALSLAELQADPMGFIWRTVWKSARLHERETIGVAWNERQLVMRIGEMGATAVKAISTAWWYAMLLAALGGIVVLTRRNGWWAALLSTPAWLWLYFTAVHAVIVIGDRYHMPAIPMIALLAAIWAQAALTTRKTQPMIIRASLRR